MAVILAGGEGERLSILSQVRAKPAVPFAGKYRIIDFTLSNCVNSDIDDVLVLTQYNPRSLNDHIGLGPAVGPRPQPGRREAAPAVHRARPGRRVVPRHGRRGAPEHERHRADPSDTVVVLAGDHIYKMDYQPFIAAHRRHRADVTIAVQRVPIGEASRIGILALDDDDRVTEWQEKPKQPKSDLASMGIYVFSKKALRRWLTEDRATSGATSSRRCSRPDARVFGYRFDGYWQDVGTIQWYWEAHMELLDDHPELDLYDQDWLIHTRSEERAPANRPDGPGPPQPHQPRLPDQRDGRNSVLSPGVRVDVGAVVRDSIVMFDSVIRAGAVVDRAILDKEVVVGQGAIVGDGPVRRPPNRQEPTRLNTGITVVGKRAVIPRGARIGRNVRVAADIRTTDFVKKVIKSGDSVERSPAPDAPTITGGRRSRVAPGSRRRRARRSLAPSAQKSCLVVWIGHAPTFGQHSAAPGVGRPWPADRPCRL